MLKQDVAALVAQFDGISLEEMDRVKLMNRVDTKFAFSTSNFLSFLPELVKHFSILEIEGTRTPRYESLYYDDVNFKMYLDHHNGRKNRFKIRYRKYVESNLSFLEIKHKFKNRTNKRRIKVDEIPTNEIPLEHMEFINKILPSQFILQPTMWNGFNRLTLVNKTENERLTLDFNLVFYWDDRKIELDNIIIAELKQENVNRNSAFYALMKKHVIRPYRLSKYCIGSMQLYDKSVIKSNRFKKKLLKINKIQTHAA
jgi:hypothetical protein